MNNKLNWKGVIGAIVGAVVFLLVLNVSPGAGIQGFIATSSAVQIPQALVLAVNGLVFGLVTAAFLWIFTTIGLNLSELAVPFAATLSTFLLGLAQNWIDAQPLTSDPYILMALNILVVVLSGLGGLAVLARATGRNTLF